MRITKNSCFVILSFFILSSCEKVIDYELKGAEPVIVIEGTITNEAGPYYVIVSKSQRFADSTQYITVNDATVIISDNVSKADTLSMTLDGLYQTHTIMGVEGRTYMLTVLVEGKTYTSICRMPYRVEFDTLIVEDDPTTDTGFALTPVYTDPIKVINFYRFNAFEGNDHIPLIRVRRDNSTNGLHVSQPVGFENYYNQDDSATLEMMCIDEHVYQYLFDLGETGKTGLSASVSPGNPLSNIAGGCLGYFSAHTIQRRSVRIQ